MSEAGRLRTRLADGVPAIGTFLQIAREPATVLVLAEAGLDFVVIDMEHGAFALPSVQRLCLTARLAGLTPLVRTPVDPAAVLDAGAIGVIAPRIDDVGAARRVVEGARLPPAGKRGISSFNAHLLFRSLPLDEVAETVERQTYVVVQVESRAAVDCAAELARVPGVDALFVGPSDLALDLGVAGRPEDKTLVEAIESVIEVGRAVERPVGIHVPDGEAAKRWIDRGMSIVAVETDARLVLDGARRVLKTARGEG